MKTAEEILKKYDYDAIKRPRPKLMLAMQEYATQERQKAIQECIDTVVKYWPPDSAHSLLFTSLISELEKLKQK